MIQYLEFCDYFQQCNLGKGERHPGVSDSFIDPDISPEAGSCSLEAFDQQIGIRFAAGDEVPAQWYLHRASS